MKWRKPCPSKKETDAPEAAVETGEQLSKMRRRA
jgi:hypothetical protein